jgi:hypothetical protein
VESGLAKTCRIRSTDKVRFFLRNQDFESSTSLEIDVDKNNLHIPTILYISFRCRLEGIHGQYRNKVPYQWFLKNLRNTVGKNFNKIASPRTGIICPYRTVALMSN